MNDRPTPSEEPLQIEQDLAFERAEARIQRVTWVVILLVLLAGLAGVFGSGPLSETTTGLPGGPLWVQHHRIARWEAPTPLQVHLGPARPSALAAVWLPRDFADAHDIERVDPPPLFVEVHPDRLHYVFYAPDTAAQATVTFTVKANGWGRREAAVGIPGGPEVPLTQIVLP